MEQEFHAILCLASELQRQPELLRTHGFAKPDPNLYPFTVAVMDTFSVHVEETEMRGAALDVLE